MKKSTPKKGKNNPKEGMKTRVKEFVDESRHNIVEGAKEVTDIYKQIEPKISEFYIEQVIPNAKNIYQSGSETAEQVAQRIQEIVEDLKQDLEIATLTRKRNKLARELGMDIYFEFVKKGSITEEFMKSGQVDQYIKKIHDKEEKILRVGSKIEV